MRPFLRVGRRALPLACLFALLAHATDFVAQADTIDLAELLNANKTLSLNSAHQYILPSPYPLNEDAQITGNSATIIVQTGPLQIINGKTLTISNCTIRGQGTASLNGDSGVMILSGVTFVGEGGANTGIYATSSRLTLSNCSFQNGNNGMTAVANSTATLTNVGFSGCASSFRGNASSVVWNGGTVAQPADGAVSLVDSQATLSNLVINQSASGSIGINFFGSSSGSLHASTIDGSEYPVQIGSGSVTINQGCVFRNGAGTGVAVNQGGSVTLDDCDFTGFSNAVDIQPHNPKGTANVSNSRFRTPTVSAVSAVDAVDVLVRNCVVEDAQADGIYYERSTGVVENCVVLRSLNTGVTFWDCPSGTIRNCLIRDSVHQGIYGAKNIDIYGNTLVANIICNILIEAGTTARIRDNISVSAPEASIRFDGVSGVSLDSTLVAWNGMGLEMKNAAHPDQALNAFTRNHREGILAYGTGVEGSLERCLFSENGQDTSQEWRSIFVNEGAALSARGCSIGLPGEKALYNNSASVSLDFARNYWGDPSGPVVQMAQGPGAKLEWHMFNGANVVYEPFLTAAPVLAVAEMVDTVPGAVLNRDFGIGVGATLQMKAGGVALSGETIGGLRAANTTDMSGFTLPADALPGALFVSWISVPIRRECSSGTISFHVAGAIGTPGLKRRGIDGGWTLVPTYWNSATKTISFTTSEVDLLNGTFVATGQSGATEARLALTQSCDAVGDNQLTLQTWDFHSASWIGNVFGSGAVQLSFDLEAARWVGVYLYDETNAAWVGAQYFYKDEWTPRAAAAGSSMAGEKRSRMDESVSGEDDLPAGASTRAVEAAFASNQNVFVESPNPCQIRVWNYSAGDWVASKSAVAGADSLSYPLTLGQWLLLTVYDESLGQYVEGCYSYAETWR
jgi:hypothetical protein